MWAFDLVRKTLVLLNARPSPTSLLPCVLMNGHSDKGKDLMVIRQDQDGLVPGNIPEERLSWGNHYLVKGTALGLDWIKSKCFPTWSPVSGWGMGRSKEREKRIKNWLTRGQHGGGPKFNKIMVDAWGPQKTSLRCRRHG